MKFTSTQENLSQGLSLVAHIASKNTTLPILNNVLIKADKTAITLSTTNLELGVNCVIRGKVDQEGSFTVQSKLITDFVNLISTETVDVSLEGDVLSIISSKSQTQVKGNAADEFPAIPQITSDAPFTCGVRDFTKAVAQTLFAVSHSETRPEISGVYMRFENGSLILASTDSYRLAEKSIRCNGTETKEVIVPGRSMAELSRILGTLASNSMDMDDEQEQVEIIFQDNQVMFSFKNIQLVSRLIEGTYPAYQQIIPNEHTTQAIIDRAECIKAVKTASLFSRLGVFDVVLEFQEGKLKISANNAQLGHSTTELDVALSGGSNSIVLNHKFLTEGLNQIDGTAVVFEMINEASPCIIRPAETLDGAEAIAKKDYLYIVMPIKQ
jgi:DNA polymerase-3 subunit beta